METSPFPQNLGLCSALRAFKQGGKAFKQGGKAFKQGGKAFKQGGKAFKQGGVFIVPNLL
jgi:hypothetical protein